MTDIHAISVIGIHPVEPSERLFQETLETQWGEGLEGPDLELAKRNVYDHFANLYLIEVLLEPLDAEIDWGEITQPLTGQPEANWQVPYDERPIDLSSGRWAFFFHFLNPNMPLQTPVGAVQLPEPTPRPPHLMGCEYEAPG